MKPATSQAKQRKAVKARSGKYCEAEVRLASGTWIRCMTISRVASHIYPRRLCAGARDLPEVVIHTCLRHNDDHLHDGRNGVRAPLSLTQLAYDTIAQRSKEVRSLGPRPQIGSGCYEDIAA